MNDKNTARPHFLNAVFISRLNIIFTTDPMPSMKRPPCGSLYVEDEKKKYLDYNKEIKKNKFCNKNNCRSHMRK
ncbi:MAG: hypothetical protein JJV93_02400 [Alphaproteobacteria bacterium]|nr:hypothetical protein [Alphaproteobacteria bacterium]MBL0718084.1 hypothetical protein [Alphaproteobacteria bacterium]